MSTDSTALEPAIAHFEGPKLPMPVMGADEIERTWRVAKALAASRFFKDATQAEAAFAKILLGRDLGLSPTEAMGALHVFDGKVEASADFHATRVKEHPDYDYSVEWLTTDDPNDEGGGFSGCEITFYGPHKGEPWQELGKSKFTVADAKRADLWNKPGKNGKPGVWKSYPRNMLFARAMSNGVAWFCPGVMGAVRIYAPGEALEAAERDVIGGELDDDVAGPLHDDPDVAEKAEALLARAAELGHAGYANRGAAAMALRGQPKDVALGWVSERMVALDEYNSTRPTDAVVVDGDDGEPVPPEGDPEAEPDEAAEGAMRAALDLDPQPELGPK